MVLRKLGFEPVEQGQASAGSNSFGNRHCPVEPYDRRLRVRLQVAVEIRDYAPIGIGCASSPSVFGCDRGLQAKLFDISDAAGQTVEQDKPGRELIVVPASSILLGKGHELAVLQSGASIK